MRAVVPEILESYQQQRRMIGILGMTLPFLCIIGGFFWGGEGLFQGPLEDSISMYWYSNMRDCFVGILSAVGLFLFAYRGYNREDTWITNLSALAAYGIALFPCLNPASPESTVGVFNLKASTSNIIHLSCASSFFLLLAFNSWFLFTKGPGGKKPTKGFFPYPQVSSKLSDARRLAKMKRNLVYRLCALIMVLTMLAIVVLTAIKGNTWLHDTRMVLWAEIVMLEAFGVSWLVKGETLFRDPRKSRS